jgi:methionyl-tRNA synthetase
MHLSLQIAANLAIAFEPFLPFTAEKLRKMLNLSTFDWKELGRIDLLKAGDQLGTPELLFEKIEDETIAAQVQKLQDTKIANEAAAYKPNAVKENVAFDDFMKMDIRVATVLDCQKVPKADKLLQFKLNDGIGERTILSGIAAYYPNPEELIGTQVCFIANFEPRKLRGIMSEGMILSAEDADGKLVLIRPSAVVTNGVEVK